MSSLEVITRDELTRRAEAQGVSHPRHWAFVCPICSTVQSPASLMAAGVHPDEVDHVLGFSCEGRATDAGPWPGDRARGSRAMARRGVRGCDWTLGGLFRIHTLEVVCPGEGGDYSRPCFQVASPAEAQALEREMSRVVAA